MLATRQTASQIVRMRKYRLKPLPEQVSPQILQQLKHISTATIGHFYPWGFMSSALRRLHPVKRVVGTAVTLTIPGPDSTLLHHVIGLVRPGDFLVIDRHGDRRHACWGGGVTRAARNAGLAGAVIDGLCTDPDEILGMGFPVWCRGVSALTTRLSDTGGRFNEPVSCGGIAVCPGDVVIADENGVVAIPADDVESIIDAAIRLEKEIANGENRLNARERLGDVYGASALVRRALESDAHAIPGPARNE